VQESEAFGLVQIEAMAFARPIINTRLPTGVVEVAEHGKEAVTVEPGNSKALADAVNFLTLNAGVWKRLSENARKKAEKFCCHRIIPSILKIYKEHAPLCN
jgi:rhamnosyl/mannosyltransferase